MPGGIIRVDLSRSYENYFTLKGGESPKVAGDVIPVIILDDNSRGPYPAFRSWVVGRSLAATAAQFSYIGVINADNTPQVRSCIVIDDIFFRTSIADDVIVMSDTITSLGLGNQTTALDAAEEKDQAPSPQPKLGNVLGGDLTQAGAVSGHLFPNGSVAPGRIPGPFTLGPNGVLAIRPSLVNNALTVWIRGRYYSAL